MQDSFSTPFDRATKVEVSSRFRINNLIINLAKMNGNGMSYELSGDTINIFMLTYNITKTPDNKVIKTPICKMTYTIKLYHLSNEQQGLIPVN